MRKFLFIILLITSILPTTLLQAQKTSLREFYNDRLIEYSINQNIPKVKWCLDSGADVNCKNPDGATSLLIACEKNNLELVKLLIEWKADPNIPAYDKFTPLMMAAYNGNLDVAEYLIQNGAKIDLKDFKGSTALHYAVALGDFVMSDMLIFYGANPRIKDTDENSCLHIAAFSADTNLISLFLKHSLIIDTINEENYTPLMIASQNGFDDVVRLLIRNGANINFRNQDGLNALSVAVFNSQNSVVQILASDSNIQKKYAPDFKNPMVASKVVNNKTIRKTLKNAGFSRVFNIVPTTFTLKSSLSFNSKDAFINWNVGIIDVNYNLGISLGYRSRFAEKQVIMEKSPTINYLVWEHRRVFDIEIQKYFYYGNVDNTDVKFFAGVDLQLVFGSIDGLNENIKTKFVPVPQIGIILSKKYTDFGFSYEYTNYKIKEIMSSKWMLSFAVRIPTKTKPEKYLLSWM